jgi:hypothetical protein
MLREIEQKLRDCWEDRRLFEIWAEYYTAVQIRERHPDWESVKVSRDIRKDVICNFVREGKREERTVEVKTGKWQTCSSDELVLTYADACFSPYQIENDKSFNYAVFFVHEDYKKVREIFVFSRDDLKEVVKRQGNRASPYYISRVESLEVLEKFLRRYVPPQPLYELERGLVEKPEVYLENWDKIK